jgi:hypothetical protein
MGNYGNYLILCNIYFILCLGLYGIIIEKVVVLTLFRGLGVLMGCGGAKVNPNTGTTSIDSFPIHKVMAGPDLTTLICCKNFH